MSHTDTPWEAKIYKDGPTGVRYIMWGNGGKESVCVSDAWPNGNARTEANAAFIVKAVNNHEKLLSALEGLVNKFPYDLEDDGSGQIGFLPSTKLAVDAAREAIKEVE